MGKLLSWLQKGGFTLLLFTGFLMLLWGSTAPVGTLVWWLDRGQKKLEQQSQKLKALLEENSAPNEDVRTCYIVFLTGVGDLSADELTEGETAFLDQLEQDQPQCVIVRDVFPYSAANADVSGQQVFDFLREVSEQANGWSEFTKFLLETRNVWRMALSADNRYGRVYNPAIALTVVERMAAQQEIPMSAEASIQLVLMGKSGGAQVALGAAPYLRQWLNAEITVVSFGGVFNGNEGFDAADQIYHLRGERDWIETIGGVVFPSRWRWVWGSPYHRARREERYRVLKSGPHAHQGDEGYFGKEEADERIRYVDLTVQQVNQLPIWADE
ncbi:MAG: hypothetical protein IGS38_07220 [Synechococcales cyanobacterium M58_A2018_015]|nr:hypothetical protein [Synechococcales cyanobacterium M58_A2018_015]